MTSTSCVSVFQGSSEAEPVLKTEEAPAVSAPPTGALHLPHQLQRDPAGVPAPGPAMPAPSCVQSERESRDGKGERGHWAVDLRHPHGLPIQTHLTLHTLTYTDRPLFEGGRRGGAEWQHSGPEAAYLLLQSTEMKSDNLSGML